ncbi:MAG: hypothetical protein EBS20_07535, partial [Actinobacteria bacterium]|nr:hypothetical protein [Actinomycetota bacterium]
FIREDGLVPLASDVAVPTDAQTVLDRLAAGPPVETGLRSVVVDPLTGTALVSVFTPTGDIELPTASVTIAVANAFSSLPPTEQVLLLGQVVLSLSSAGFTTVSVVDAAGAPLAVPLPDGRLLWSGEEFTFGILSVKEIYELGLDPTGRQRSLAMVASRGCRHVLARVLIGRLDEPVVER